MFFAPDVHVVNKIDEKNHVLKLLLIFCSQLAYIVALNTILVARRHN